MNDDGDGTEEKNPRRRALRPRGARVSDLSRAFGFRAAGAMDRNCRLESKSSS